MGEHPDTRPKFDAHFQERPKILLKDVGVIVPLLSNACLNLYKELLDRIHVRRVGELKEPHSSLSTHLLQSLRVMDGGIVHNKDGFRLRPFTAVSQARAPLTPPSLRSTGLPHPHPPQCSARQRRPGSVPNIYQLLTVLGSSGLGSIPPFAPGSSMPFVPGHD